MTSFQLGVLGAGDPVGDAWAAAAADSPEFAIARRWPGDAASPDALAGEAAVQGLLIADPARSADLLLTAARSGKPVVCPAPVAPSWDAWRELTRQAPAGAALLAGSELRTLVPLTEARRIATSGEAGSLYSAYLAYRARPGGPDLDALLFGALDYLHWCIGADATSVWATRRQAPDAIIAHFSFPDNRKATVEAALTLPATFPQAVEFEVELMCRDATLRAAPFDQTVVLQAADGAAARPWFPSPALHLLDGLRRAAAGAMAGTRTWADDGPVLRLVDAVRQSLTTGEVVTAAEAGSRA